ncbi:MAG TPA: hypothetical protein VGG74_12090 [Kofleriaceae bacterium]
MTTMTETTMTSDAPRRMACAVGRELDLQTENLPPRMTMLREIVHVDVHVHVSRARARSEDDELDATARLRRAVHEAVAATRKRPE